MKNRTWITITGIQKQEILSGLGFVIEGENVKMNGVYSLDSDGNKIIVDDVQAVIGGKNGELILITDISELELYDEDEEGIQ